jgi:dihydroorotase
LGKIIDLDLPVDWNPDGLFVLPALIDPHVHFRIPGGEQKEDWQTGAQAAIAGGVTTVFDMPNNNPPVIDGASLANKNNLIDTQLRQAEVPLRHHLYFGATPDNLAEIEKIRNEVVGIKIFMGASTGSLLVDNKEDQEKWFKKAAELNMVVAVHAENEEIVHSSHFTVHGPKVSDHSRIRPREAAVKAVTQALEMAKKYGTRLYILHVSTIDELDLIRQAKKEGVNVFAEATPHHLFLNDGDYQRLGTRAQMNPPLRTKADNDALWKAIDDGTIDTIGTDHAPHTLSDKQKPYGEAPSGVLRIENYLALLLSAYHEGKITIEKIVELTHDNPQKIFGLIPNDDLTIVDLNKTKLVKDEEQKTKCKWSPYVGMKLRGWPIATLLNKKLYF